MSSELIYSTSPLYKKCRCPPYSLFVDQVVRYLISALPHLLPFLRFVKLPRHCIPTWKLSSSHLASQTIRRRYGLTLVAFSMDHSPLRPRGPLHFFLSLYPVHASLCSRWIFFLTRVCPVIGFLTERLHVREKNIPTRWRKEEAPKSSRP